MSVDTTTLAQALPDASIAEDREAWYETHEFTYMLLTARKEYRILRHPEVVTL